MTDVNLESLTDDELRKELERRAAIAKEAAKFKMIVSPDLTRLRQVCQDYIDCLDDEEHRHRAERYEVSICEMAIRTFFGDEIFNWIYEKYG